MHYRCPECNNETRFIQFQITETRQDVVIDAHGNEKFVKEIYGSTIHPDKNLECEQCGYTALVSNFIVEG